MESEHETLGREEHERAIERRTVVEEKLRHDVRQMIEVLKVDIPAFMTREAKRRFTSSDIGERWDDAKLRAFKSDVAAAGERSAAQVASDLTPWDAWAWDPRRPFPEDPRGLEPNARVWSSVRKVGDELAGLLEKYGFPDAPAARESYKLPSYFVAGRFMKSLVESYWRGLQECVELSRLIEEAGSRERRDRLGGRWDKA